MNIFILSTEPEEAARQHCDCHTAKMGTEACQMLSTAHWLLGSSAPYRPAWRNHPCTVWARASRANYVWLVRYGAEMFREYTARYGRTHAAEAVLTALTAPPATLQDVGITPFHLGMPVPYRVPGDAVASYRNFYQTKRGGRLGTWKRNKPAWWLE